MVKKRIIKGTIIFVIYIMILAYLIRYVINNADIMDKIIAASCSYVVFGMCTTFLNFILTALLDITCAKTYKVNIPLLESVGLTFVSSLVNLVMPLQLGSIVKAMYFKKKMSLTYSKYISIISGTTIIGIIVAFVQLIICLIFSAFRWNVEKVYMIGLIAIFVTGVIFLGLMCRFQERILRIVPLKKYTLPILQGFFELINDKRTMFSCSLNYILSAILGGVRFFLIFRMLDVNTDILNGMLYYGIYAASSTIPILPGNIGISEVLVGIMNSILGSEFNIGVTVVLINRIFYYLIAIVGALISAFPIWRMFNQEKTQKE